MATNTQTNIAKKPVDYQSGHRARLRSRFLDGGANAIADYELLEMILFAAKPRGDVKPLAKLLLKEFGDFASLIKAPAHKILDIEGVGDAVLASIKLVEASCEHLLREQLHDRPIINSWTALLDYCQIAMAHNTREEFRIIFLNNKNMLIADEVQQTGTVDHTPVYPREVLKRALELGASALILSHNHPSGDPTPSKADIDMTKALCDAARPFNIRIHDHLIIAKHKHYSFKSNGLI